MSAIRLAALVALLAAPAFAQVTTPSEHLDRPLGVDFDLADWEEVGGYFRRLGAESDRTITRKVGTTTEGRDFLITIISSPENLADLDGIKRAARLVADPRGASPAARAAAIDDGRVVLFVSSAMHSTEAAGAQFAMAFAHALATEESEPWRSAREKVVTVLYVTNPDGVDHVTEWYRETVGTPHESAGLLKLYQLYSGHDNNRDWFMLTQAETRIVTELLYSEWFPQVYWDVHQQGSRRERFFVPPFRDPLNPNLDPAIITGIDALGSRALMDLTREGFTGVSTGVSYDMWWNGGNRNVPVRHNIIGLLTEAASVRLGSPMFFAPGDLAAPRGIETGYAPSNRFPAPWPGGWWRLGDIIEYEMAFGRSLLGSLSREPDHWLRNSMQAAERTIARGREGAPRAWLIPADNRDRAAVRRLADVLLAGGVELSVAQGPVSADGRTYPAGTIVIGRDQPYGAHVKDLFDIQTYPDGPPPYDVAGWTLPLLLGVRRVEVMGDVEATLLPATSPAAAAGGIAGDSRLAAAPAGSLSTWDSATWTALAGQLAAGRTLSLVTAGERAGLLLPGTASSSGPAEDAPADRFRSVRGMPRIGLYAPWSGTKNEGWLRYVLDSFEIPYVRVRNEMIRAGRLADLVDVLVLPGVSAGALDRGRSPGSVPDAFARGLAPEGAVAVEEFVRGGGTLVAMEGSASWAIELLRLPLVDVTRGDDANGFACPGSVVRVIPEADRDLTAGLPDSLAVFFSRASAYREMTADERKERSGADAGDAPVMDVLLRYAPTRVLLSGWMNEPATIAGRAAWIRARHGAGRVHLFGFRPQYRGWSQAGFGLLFRAMLLE